MSPAARLAAFALVVAATFAGGAALGAAAGPEPDREAPAQPHEGVHP